MQTIQRFLLAAIIVLGITCYTEAAKVNVQEAQTIALNFYKANVPDFNPHNPVTATLKFTQMEPDNTVSFYVFDINPAGFVIVSADDIATPVLAYSTETNFKTNFEKLPLNLWVKNTSATIYQAIIHHAPATERTQTLWAAYRQGENPNNTKSATVSPMLTTTWDQESLGNPPPYLYNIFCPHNATHNQRCLTGCVATSMAQIMKYWSYPAHGTGSFSYDNTTANGYTYNYGTQSANFGATTYEWDKMPAKLTGSTSASSDTAVSLLMYHCGVGVGMDYGDDNQAGSAAWSLQVQAGSGEPCAERAFKNYFSYNTSTIQGIEKENYTASAWLALIKGELDAQRPVIYEGEDNGEGHAWVCDGYDANNMLHMNWGWSGDDNGYFTTTDLTTTGNYNPIEYQDALIGIQPPVGVPQARFSANNAINCNSTSATVQFQDVSTGSPTSWLWNFGDNGTSTQQNPAHTYNSAGNYAVTLKVTNANGSTTKKVLKYVSVVSTGIDSAIATATAANNGQGGTASVTYIGGVSPFTFSWSNGGTTQNITGLTPGDYTVKVTDKNGCTKAATTTVANNVTTGLNALEEIGLKVYPNPLSSGNWQLETGAKWIGGDIEVYDSNGRIVYKAGIKQLKTEITLDVARGIYMMKVSTLQQQHTFKLIRL